jgi:hypothetical protein
LIGAPIRSGEGVVMADLNFSHSIDRRKQLMDSAWPLQPAGTA